MEVIGIFNSLVQAFPQTPHGQVNHPKRLPPDISKIRISSLSFWISDLIDAFWHHSAHLDAAESKLMRIDWVETWKIRGPLASSIEATRDEIKRE